MSEELEVKVDTFQPRWYQRELINSLEHEGKNKFAIVWPRRCLSGDSHITMADGSWKLLKDIIPGDEVLSWDGLKFTSDVVKYKWETEPKATKIIQARGYLPLTASNDHEFASLTRSCEDFQWRKLEDLKSRHQVLQYSGISCGNINNPDLAEFIGYMITDGYCSGYQQPKFTNTNMEILKRVEYLTKKLFDYEVIWRPKGNGYDLGMSNGTRGGGATGNKVKDMFRKYNLDVSRDKRRMLPILWKMDRESIGRFFAAVISSDGSIYLHKKGFISDRGRVVPPSNEITISCGLSYLLAMDMYWLLRKIGIVPQVPCNERESNWKIKVSKGYAVKELLSYGPIYGKQYRQNNALSRISKNPYKQKAWNKCNRCGYKIVESNSKSLYDIETRNNHNFIANGYIVHNSGKDVAALNIMLRQAFKRVGTYYYLYPKKCQCRKAIWDAMLITGEKFIDFIPKRLIANKNNIEMKLTLVNGSIIQFTGCDNADALRGTNPVGVVFSEYSRVNHPEAYNGVVAPILAANDGWVIFISTPNGHNEFYTLFKYAESGKDPDWYTTLLTVDNTKHMSEEKLAKEKERMSDELFIQEYYCFPGNTGILTPNGVSEICNVKPNDMIVSHSGRFRRVIGVIEREYSGDMIEISSYGSYENIICTPNHPVRIYSQSTQSYNWVAAGKIKYGDRVVFPKRNISDEKIISYELCMLMAWYITEGSSFKNGLQFTLGNECEKLRVTNLIKLLGYSYKVYRTGTAINIVVNSTYLLDFFKSNCGSISYNKNIPMSLIIGHEQNFFHELIKGDGCFSVHNEYRKFCYTTVSKQLAYQIQLLSNSLNLGYAAGITMRPARVGNIDGRIINCSESYCINIGYNKPKFKSNLLRAKNCIAALVKDVRKFEYDGKVYNLKVQYDESYIANGRAVHNCSFEVSNTGAYYAKYVHQAYADKRIGFVPHDTSHQVFTAWDLGWHCPTVIVFYQVIGRKICVIDHYHKNNEDLSHYVSIVRSYSTTKGYMYKTHFVPHDAVNHNLEAGTTRVQILERLGLMVEVLKKSGLLDGIEIVRHTFKRIFFDENNCGLLLDALEAYSREWDPVSKRYINDRKKDWTNDHADVIRYMCMSLDEIDSNERSPEEFDNACKKYLYGEQVILPPVFTDR